MLNLRAFALLLAFAASAACSSPTKVVSGEDGGAPIRSGNCADLRGFFRTLTESADCNSYRASLPQAVCIAQDGCELTVETGGQLLKGWAEGRKFTLSADSPVRTECTGEIADDDLQMNCTSTVPLAREPYTCDFPAVRRTSDLETTYCCDLMAQDCGVGEKCNLVSIVSNRDPLASVCLPLKGTAGHDEACERYGTEELNAGNDDCAEGLFCSGVGIANSAARRCRSLCLAQSDCRSDEICYAVSQVPVAGFCLPSCEVFGDQCGAGTTCRQMGALDASGRSVVGTACSTTGGSAIGAQCGSETECPAGATCHYQPGERSRRCRSFCDADHACGPNFRCVPLDDGDTTGVCVAR